MKTLNSPFSQIAWRDKTYTRKENGTIEVPDEAEKELVDIGCKRMGSGPSAVAEILPSAGSTEETEPKKGKSKKG